MGERGSERERERKSEPERERVVPGSLGPRALLGHFRDAEFRLGPGH